MNATLSTRSTLRDFAAEPFRIFFPAGVLAGIVGVSLWPLHFLGLMELYPGLIHGRIMACGLFGGFIFGFLGTAMPRMLSAKPLRITEAFGLLAVYAAMVAAFTISRTHAGDLLFLLLLFLFAVCMGRRVKSRKDTPPPGFVLVGLALLSADAGGLLAVLQHWGEMDSTLVALQRLLSYQGFVLLPILGIGPFILPRLFGLQSAHDFPEALTPSPGWKKKALLALAAGLLILASLVVEARGAHRTAYALRFATTLAYLWLEMPFHRVKAGHALGASIRIAFVGILAGFLAVALFPGNRIGLLHLTLVGGFAIVTFVVATRVVFGHSGNINLLKGRIRWLWIAVGLMLLGMATRISGDFWPKILASHYNYGALLWIAGVVLWAIYVLPKVLVVEKE
jgi:uncharacterized protein involved in response to NO